MEEESNQPVVESETEHEDHAGYSTDEAHQDTWMSDVETDKEPIEKGDTSEEEQVHGESTAEEHYTSNAATVEEGTDGTTDAEDDADDTSPIPRAGSLDSVAFPETDESAAQGLSTGRL